MVLPNILNAQQILIRGVITDASSNEPLPFVNVVLLPTNLAIGTTSDDHGRYTLTFAAKGESISFSFVGYETVTIPLSQIKTNVLDVKMNPVTAQITGVLVSATRTRYRNRDNPAVELIRKVIANKDNNRIEAHDSYQYERYEKITLSLNDLNDSVKNKLLFKQFPFLQNYIDTSKLTGQLSVPVFLRENISEHYYRKQPKAEKEIQTALRMADYNEFIEQDALGVYIDGMVTKSNIYDNQIKILENDYMSPLSPVAPTFYRYHIVDTVNSGGLSCIRLSVYPRNDQDFGLRGFLFITNDDACAVKRAELSFTRNASVNFVNNFSLVQEYSLIDSTWCLTFDEAFIDFGLTGKRNLIAGKRSNSYTNYRFNHIIDKNIFSGGNTFETVENFDERSDNYWNENRHTTLSRSEQGVYDMIDEMKTDRTFRHLLNLSGWIYSGHINVGKFDLGPVESFFSFNDIEGGRVSFGGKTNAWLHPSLFFEGYVAYGLKDKKFKYKVGAMYSFYPKNLHQWEYPMNLLGISYEDNIETPGQFFLWDRADRFFSSFHRGNANKMVYHRTFTINYEYEFLNGFSFKPTFSQRVEHPTGELVYTNNGGDMEKMTITQLGLRLRYAPNERFYRVQRIQYTLNHTNPVFTVNYVHGIKDLLGGDYSFQRLEASVVKRTWLSSYGFADMTLKAGKMWGSAPFRLLIIPQANQDFSYQDDAFNMMNYMEFVNDRYVQGYISYCFNGLLFNRLPLIRKLKWREFVTFKALWGDISANNLPENRPTLFRFPVDDNGVPSMYRLSSAPYMEAGVAIDNIFKIFRIDLVKRINYLDHPDVPEWSVRFKFRFAF